MKKTILVLVVAFMTVACVPFFLNDIMTITRLEWYVKNSTDVQLRLVSADMDETVPPDDIVRVCDISQDGDREPRFYRIKDCFERMLYNERYVAVLSAEGDTLRKWLYADRDKPDKQFFNEKWRHLPSDRMRFQPAQEAFGNMMQT